MKVLVTGGNGFIGSHLCENLKSHSYDVVKCSRSEREGCTKLDILDMSQVQYVIKMTNPDIIINLAGEASVALSWKNPQNTLAVNLIGFTNILEAVKNMEKKIRVVGIGSSEVYGNLVENNGEVTEIQRLNPLSPYAVSKVAQEEMAMAFFRAYGVNVVLVRCFNVAGSGQKRGFMVSDFAAGIAEIEKGKKDRLTVGNLESIRDFTHVKDVAEAIRKIAEKGQSGEVYNICSGKVYAAKEILQQLCSMSEKEIVVQYADEKKRPYDMQGLKGNHDKLTLDTGWVPSHDINIILSDNLAYWREKIN